MRQSAIVGFAGLWQMVDEGHVTTIAYAAPTSGSPKGGTAFKVEGCDILTVRDGKIAAKRSYRKSTL